MKTRTRLCLVVLLLTPLAVYWQTVFHDFGLRDDYSYLREAREEPGKIVHFTAAQGRPLYGALLETSYFEIATEANLGWLRLASVLLLTATGLALWRQLVLSEWGEVEATAVGLGFTLLPAAQVAAGWAALWPHALALLLALAGFSAIETELERGGLKRFVALAGGGLIYTLAGLIYPSNALLAVVPLAGVLLTRTGREPLGDLRWLATHLLALVGGLAVSYAIFHGLFALGIFQASPRLAWDAAPLSKALWFLVHPLANALGLFVLRDDFHHGEVLFWLAVAAAVAVIGVAVRGEWRRGDRLTRARWLVCLLLLPLLAHAVSLVAAERLAAYRTQFALAGLVLVVGVHSLRLLLARRLTRVEPVYAIFGFLGVAAALAAHWNALTLLAEPQGREWQVAERGALRIDPARPATVFLVAPGPADRSTPRMYGDEFGSLSSDSDWVPREMLQAALRLRFPDLEQPAAKLTIRTGRQPPAAGQADVVIDFRALAAPAAN